MEIKLGLLGKNIKHSRSKEMYQKLLQTELDYSLFDFQSNEEIPTLKEFFQKVHGLSITAPYKRHFLNELILSPEIKDLNAVNCLKEQDGKFYGTNTDYLAVEKILKDFQQNFGAYEVFLLGDGAMSFMTQKVLHKLDIPYQVYSRKMTPDFFSLDLSKVALKDSSLRPLIINSCGRSYVYQKELRPNSIFWDYNYSFPEHSSQFENKIEYLMDGEEMLFLQAKFALEYWKIPIPKEKNC